MRKSVEELEKLIIEGRAADVTSLRCPSCGSGLTVAFYDRASKRALSIQCGTLCLRSNIDGLAIIPAWVAELGPRFTTSGS